MKVGFSIKLYIVSLPLILVTQSAYAHENTTAKIYKTIDASGKVSYSEDMTYDSIIIEEIVIAPAPQKRDIENYKARLDRIREITEDLTEAREKREAKREAAENERLERLALIRAANQSTYERKVYASYPLWRPFPQHFKSFPRHHKKHHFDLPVRKPRISLYEQFSTSFSHR